MDTIFSRLLENNFAELPGLTMNARIPVPESLVNEMIQAQLRGNRNIASCQVSIQRENRLSVQLRTPRWPWPLTLKLQLFGSVDLTGSPTIRAFLENNLLLGKLGALLKGLPPGILLYDDQVSVNLEPFLKPEQKKLLSLVKSVQIHTKDQLVILDISIQRD